MKKLLLLLSFFTVSFGYSQDWKLISETKDGNYYYKPNTDNTAWIKLVSDKMVYYPNQGNSKAKTVDGYTMTLYKYDCSQKKIGIARSTVYSKDGKVLDNINKYDFMVEMDYVEPDSKGEKFLLAFCKTE